MRASTKQALNRFDKAAQDWGCQSDQGYVAKVIAASEREYKASKAALKRAIEREARQKEQVKRGGRKK